MYIFCLHVTAFHYWLKMLLIIISLVVLVLALSAIFFLFADGDLTLMWIERFGHRAGDCIYILYYADIHTFMQQ